MSDPTKDQLDEIIDAIINACEASSVGEITPAQFEEMMQTAKKLIATEVAEAKSNLLKGTANNNYAPDLGTYDYDGIAEDVLAELEKL